jgi:hypothetical protein
MVGICEQQEVRPNREMQLSLSLPSVYFPTRPRQVRMSTWAPYTQQK